MSQVYNLNSHPIKCERKNGSIYEYPPDGRLLRLQTVDEIIDTIDGNSIVQKVYFEPEDQEIPEPEPGVWYIVPSQVTQILRRPDFISPDTKASYGARRDDKGQIMSVSRFRVCDVLRTQTDDGVGTITDWNRWSKWRDMHPGWYS